MAKAEIYPGNCGYSTTVQATRTETGTIELHIDSQCAAIRKMAAELPEVDPMQNMNSRRQAAPVLLSGMKFCSHAACPVPVGVLKAVEVEAGLNLPVDVSIKVSK